MIRSELPLSQLCVYAFLLALVLAIVWSSLGLQGKVLEGFPDPHNPPPSTKSPHRLKGQMMESRQAPVRCAKPNRFDSDCAPQSLTSAFILLACGQSQPHATKVGLNRNLNVVR